MNRAKTISSLALTLALAACGSATETTPTAAPAKPVAPEAHPVAVPVAPAAATPPTLRLPAGVSPSGYRATLAVDPSKPNFTGHIEITLSFDLPTTLFWLNGHGLTIDKAQLTPSAGRVVTLATVPGGAEFIGFRAPAPIPAGAATLTIDYRGTVDAVDTLGIFRQKAGAAWYLYTQFEETAARRAFPCFDEPGYKVPWQLTLEVPAGQLAVANTPVESQTPTDHGTVKVRFRQTKPLPSYLVAFGVGPFEVVDAGKTKNGVPVRIVTLEGRTADAAWAARNTAHIIDLLEDYFGMPYPYAKADALVVPKTVGFSAMENPGLITYTETVILIRPDESSVERRRKYIVDASHELAHQWFGDLVTPAWWNDIWLNESFATWMESRITNEIDPSWQMSGEDMNDRREAMDADSLASVLPIIRPIRVADDIESAFGWIIYQKGSSVIRMFEHWVGVDTFRKGVRAYLEAHAWKNATSAEFLDAIGVAAGKDVTTPFSTFLEQPGAPQVSFQLRCETHAPSHLTLTQERYLPLGSSANADVTWQIPVCVKYPARHGVKSACTLLTKATGEMTLEKAAGCPAWIEPNADGIGYYRSKLSDQLLTALLGRGWRRLSLAEKLGVVDDVRAQVASGGLPARRLLDLVKRLGHEKSHYLAGVAASIVREVDELLPAEARPALAAYVRGAFGKRAHALGWKPRRGESLDDSESRPELVPLVADLGRDKRLSLRAVKLARAWLEDRTAIAPSMTEAALEVAAKSGGAQLFDAFVAEAGKTSSRHDRLALFRALAAFREPSLLARALGLLLGDDFDIRDTRELLRAAEALPAQRKAVLAFVVANYDALIAKMPLSARHRLARVAAYQCDDSERAAVTGLLAKIATLREGENASKQAMESFELCVARSRGQATALSDYFGSAKR